MRSTSYHLPADNNQRLIQPDLRELPAHVERNKQLLQSATFTVGGVSFVEAAANAREECLAQAGEYTQLLGVHVDRPSTTTIIACGHQPGFHHPGVEFKNHLVDALATETSGCGVNVVIDTDAAANLDFRVPHVLDGKARVAHFRCLRPRAGVAYEEMQFDDPQCVADLPGKVLPLLPCESSQAGALQYLGFFAEAMSSGLQVSHAFTYARRKVEESRGICNLELPYSAACGFDAFHLLVVEIIRRREEFAAIYNNCLAEYRRKFKVRGKANPLPNLAVDADRVELPLWAWRAGEPRRSLWARPKAGAVELLAGNEAVAALTRRQLADPAAGIDALRSLAAHGWRVRSKALVTTIYIRLFLCDLFVHGIGGGNYDLITDDIIWAFFGIDPPAYAVATANVSMPFPQSRVTLDDARRLKHEMNRMRQGPANRVRGSEPGNAKLARLLAQRTDLLRKQLAATRRREKHMIFAHVKSIDAALREKIAPLITQKEAELLKAQDALHYNEIVTDREYPFCIYPQEVLDRVYGLGMARLSPAVSLTASR